MTQCPNCGRDKDFFEVTCRRCGFSRASTDLGIITVAFLFLIYLLPTIIPTWLLFMAWEFGFVDGLKRTIGMMVDRNGLVHLFCIGFWTLVVAICVVKQQHYQRSIDGRIAARALLLLMLVWMMFGAVVLYATSTVRQWEHEQIWKWAEENPKLEPFVETHHKANSRDFGYYHYWLIRSEKERLEKVQAGGRR